MSQSRESAVGPPGPSPAGRLGQRARPLHRDFRLHRGDARSLERRLRTLASHIDPNAPDAPFVTTTVTSPPYANLIDYGVSGQIGFGQRPEEYRTSMREVFATLHRWTRPEGSMWLIVDTLLDQSNSPSTVRRLPFELADLAEDCGWTLRDVIIWRKDKTRPWAARGRLRNEFEYVLFFVKSASFVYHLDRVRDAADLARWWVRYPERYNPQGKTPTNVWDIPIPVQGSWRNSGQAAHACPLPVELVRRIITLSSDENDVVCDPFAGIGTVVAAAEAMGRRGWGLELNESFCEAYRNGQRSDIIARFGDDTGTLNVEDLRRTVLNLRAAKYPKALVAGLRKSHPEIPRPRLAAAVASIATAKRNAHQLLEVSTLFVAADSTDADAGLDLERALKGLSLRAPLTKYGISGDISVVTEEEFARRLGDTPLWLYKWGRTWSAENDLPLLASQVTNLSGDVGKGNYPPIVANVRLQLVDDGRLPIDQRLVTD